MASSDANLLEQKKAFTWEKSSTPRGFCWYTNMAAVSLFWNTNMAAVTSCENALLHSVFYVPGERNPLHFLWFNPVNTGHPLSTSTFYGPISVRIDCSKETQFRLGSVQGMIFARVSVHCTKHARAGLMQAWENSQNFATLLLVSPRNVTSEEHAQKFHTDDVSLRRPGLCFWLVEAQPISIDSGTSSVWNFWACFSRGNK